MKLAMNITREPLAGITATNLSLLNYLHGSDTEVIGIELNAYRSFLSAVAYRHLSPDWFTHHVISTCDYSLMRIVKRAKTLKDVEDSFSEIIITIRGILRRERPDIVLLNGTYFMPWLISIAARYEKIPVVLWYAGILSKETEDMGLHFRNIFALMERSIVRNATRIIFPLQICKDAVYSLVAKSTKVQRGIVISNPISPIFTRSAVEYPVDRRIACIGRYTKIKNINGFFKLHKKLLTQGWKHQATLVSNIPKKDLKNIPKTIRIIPSMHADELKTFYASQGLVVSPSIFETFGNVPIEAACIGIPVLVNETIGCSEILKNAGLERMVASFDNIDEICERVKELCGAHILPRQVSNLRKSVDTQYIANTIVTTIRQSF